MVATQPPDYSSPSAFRPLHNTRFFLALPAVLFRAPRGDGMPTPSSGFDAHHPWMPEKSISTSGADSNRDDNDTEDDDDTEDAIDDPPFTALVCSIADSRNYEDVDSERIGTLPHFKPWPESFGKLAKKFELHRKSAVPMGVMTGPAVRLTWWCTLIQAVYFTLLLWPGSHVDTCRSSGLGELPGWWSVTFELAFAFSIVVAAYNMRYTFPPFWQTVNKTEMDVLGRGMRLKPMAWLVWHALLTFLSVANTACICKFTISVMAVKRCPFDLHGHKMDMDAIWTVIWRQSMLFDWVGAVSLYGTAEILFVLSLAPHAVALLFTTPWPWNENQVNYTLPKYEAIEHLNWEYDTFLTKQMNHGAALAILSEAVGLTCCVACLDTRYARAKFLHQVKDKERPREWRLRCVRHAMTQCERSLIRTGVGGWLKSALQLNLQITILTCRRAALDLSGAPMEPMCLAVWSIFLGCVNVALILVDAIKVLRFIHEALDTLDTLENAGVDKKVPPLLRSLRHCEIWLACLTVLCIVTVGYAGCKMFMTFQCPDKTWNMNGCVDLSSLRFASSAQNVDATPSSA